MRHVAEKIGAASQSEVSYWLSEFALIQFKTWGIQTASVQRASKNAI
jgi:hypothetical protein